jgi:asparagine synthase (glutamine-hydrolysing)
MCGIAGYIGINQIDGDRIQRTLNLMKNRGPDHQDHTVIAQNGRHIYLLHSRLSIIDLDARSHQPFTIGDATIVYNGEIYNYVELRESLQAKGVSFRTTSDTEVLLQSYLHYGEKCVDLFEGMWSFAIYDRSRATLFLSRDRFAEKPLYYLQTEDGFFFASETRFLKALSGRKFSVNHRHLLRYMINGYKSLYKSQETFFDQVEELPYATNMIVNGIGKIREEKYWRPEVEQAEMSRGEAVAGVKERLLESVRIRLRSDVPLAFCLSGGIDSASLSSIAAKVFKCDVATFSIIDADERYDERENIMHTIQDLGCRHTLIELKHENVLLKLNDLIAYHDAPVATITYYIHSLLSEAISQNGYRVAFSGTAADELFTGYYDHFILHLYEMRDHPDYGKYLADWQNHVQKFIRNPHLRNPDLYVKNRNMRDHVFDESEELRTYLKDDFIEPFTEEYYCDSLLRNRMLNEIFHEATRVILHEDDLNSMKYSVENRSPYLDSRLLKFVYSIPAEYLIHNG